jgi:hypothetical protein
MFTNIRKKHNLNDSVSLKVNENWTFHRIGITGSQLNQDINKIGSLATFDEILDYTKLRDQLVDIIKMDIEYAEWNVLKTIDIDYLCTFVKQFLIETHPSGWKSVPGTNTNYLKLLQNLEKCFLLFHRDTRFFFEKTGRYGFPKTEFQEPRTYKIDLNDFKDEKDMIDYLVTFGELYYVNEKFLV